MLKKELAGGRHEEEVIEVVEETDTLRSPFGAELASDLGEDARGGGKAEREDGEDVVNARPVEAEVCVGGGVHFAMMVTTGHVEGKSPPGGGCGGVEDVIELGEGLVFEFLARDVLVDVAQVDAEAQLARDGADGYAEGADNGRPSCGGGGGMV